MPIMRDLIEADEYPGFYMIEGARNMALSKDGILLNVKTGYIRKWQLIAGRWQIKAAHDKTQWRPLGTLEEERSKIEGTVPVVRYNTETGENKIYSSTADCATDNDISMTCLNWRLNSGRIQADKCIYKYLNV